MRMPSLKGLYVFRHAAQSLSLKDTAAMLNVTPQAVSLQIRSLEEQLGYALFERTGSTFLLTSAGEQLLHYLQRGFELIEDGLQHVQSLQGRTTVRVCVSPWFAIHYLLAQLDDFEQGYSQHHLELKTSVAFPNMAQLDVAVQWGFGQWPHADKTQLLADDKILVASPHYLSRHDLSDKSQLNSHRMLCTPLSIALWQRYTEVLGVDVLVDRQTLVVDSHATLVEAVEKGLGLALLSTASAQEGIASGTLVAPFGARPISELNASLQTGYWLVVRDGARGNRAVDDFIQWLTAIVTS